MSRVPILIPGWRNHPALARFRRLGAATSSEPDPTEGVHIPPHDVGPAVIPGKSVRPIPTQLSPRRLDVDPDPDNGLAHTDLLRDQEDAVVIPIGRHLHSCDTDGCTEMARWRFRGSKWSCDACQPLYQSLALLAGGAR